MKKSQNESGYSNPISLGVAAIAVCSSLVFGVAALAPASASDAYAVSGNGATGYFPDQFVNQGKALEMLPDSYGDTGLAARFPEEAPVSNVDAAPEMYS